MDDRHRLVRRRASRPPAAGAMAGNAVAPHDPRGRLNERAMLVRLARARRCGGAGGGADRRRSARSSRSPSSLNLAAAIGRLGFEASCSATPRMPTEVGPSPASRRGSSCAGQRRAWWPCRDRRSGQIGALVVGIACIGGLVYRWCRRALRRRRHRVVGSCALRRRRSLPTRCRRRIVHGRPGRADRDPRR